MPWKPDGIRCKSRRLPVMSFIIEYEMNPNDKPSVILSEKGIIESGKKEQTSRDTDICAVFF
ncbi:MAG: hypothetical protein HUU08_02730 [Candidatus Brocadia sp.]|nr:hypothetical protein [Candidatus Brocadia sp.]